MSMQRYDELCKRRSELKNWWHLRTNRNFSQGNYVLRVDVIKPSMIAFCGQEYAGAKNYHDAPGWFGEIVRKAISVEANAITRKAVEAEIERLTSEIDSLKEQVMAEFSKSESVET